MAFDFLLSPEAWLGALLIFALRVLNNTLDTVRLLMVMRGKKLFSWILGFLVSVIYVLVFASVFSNLDNPLYIASYAAGFATGNVIGMWIEERMALGYLRLDVISPGHGAELAEKLRADGFAVTEVSARGKDGMVSMLTIAVLRKRVELAERIIRQVDENAFVTIAEMRTVHHGFWRL
jgi:uncharacterized protein YebE (UPF0316 family)